VSGRRFWIALAGIGLLALALRVGYGLDVGMGHGIGDDDWYHRVANGLADGRGFSDPFASLVNGHRVPGLAGKPIPTAFHLPAFPWFLAIFSELGLRSYTAHQAVGWALGAGTAVLVALAARELWGSRAALVAGAIAAVFPPLIANDSVGMSESLYGILIAAVLLFALRLRRRPGWPHAVALGVALAAAALTRQETLLLLVLLLPWVARRARPRDAAVVAAVVIVLCAPWAIRNTAVFDRPVALTTGDGSVFAGANVPSTYHGPLLGSADFGALFRSPVGRTAVLNEAVQSSRWRREGLSFARDHASRLPAVVAARVLRSWGFYPFSPRARAAQVAFLEDRSHAVELIAWPAMVVALVLAGFGLVALRRSRGPVWLLITPGILITVISATGYGAPRLAQAGDVALVVLAGGGALELWDRGALRPASLRRAASRFARLPSRSRPEGSPASHAQSGPT
jgi:4-amino-4-deoxy-L-arabinose transferase-like glycosyltransferase